MTVKIDFLKKHTESIEKLTNVILGLRDKHNVVVDEEEAQKLVDALEGLRIAIETTEIA